MDKVRTLRKSRVARCKNCTLKWLWTTHMTLCDSYSNKNNKSLRMRCVIRYWGLYCMKNGILSWTILFVNFQFGLNLDFIRFQFGFNLDYIWITFVLLGVLQQIECIYLISIWNSSNCYWGHDKEIKLYFWAC